MVNIVVPEDDAKGVHSPSPHSSPAQSPVADEERPKLWGIEIRLLVLPLLTAQNATAVLLMRAVRSLAGQDGFSTQTAVIMQEVFKGLACCLILMCGEGTLESAWDRPNEALKTAVPALLYLLQNNLQYLAVTILDTATYTVSYQLKTFWTAALSMLLLRRVIPLNKWVAIAILTVGVAMVNLGGSAKSEKAAVSSRTNIERIGGLALINLAAIASALAGVYFEKILKEVKVSLWTRNLQLAFYSVVIGYASLLGSSDADSINRNGFFHGYTVYTWLCIASNAFGGLLCGCVIKYADAVAKDVSIGASIVLSTLGSVVLFSYDLSMIICVGIVFVIYSVGLYSGNLKLPFGALAR